MNANLIDAHDNQFKLKLCGDQSELLWEKFRTWYHGTSQHWPHIMLATIDILNQATFSNESSNKIINLLHSVVSHG